MTSSARASRTNDVAVAVAGPKRRIQEQPAGFPDLPADIEDMFSADDKAPTRLVWHGTHTGSYAGIKAAGKRVQVMDFAIWRFKAGQVVEISTIQDQFALLKQIGYLPAKSTRRSRPLGRACRRAHARPHLHRKARGPSCPRPRWRHAWCGGFVPLAAAGGNGMSILFPAAGICPTWTVLPGRFPGIRLSGIRSGARASRLTRNVADGQGPPLTGLARPDLSRSGQYEVGRGPRAFRVRVVMRQTIPYRSGARPGSRSVARICFRCPAAHRR
jgi:predicted ester cyclase